ncbi:MAG: glycosyltransferase [Nitrosopumilaceae archaeon]|nr:glycosyltransferase [Nitrosopumilaceae archaeon]NIU01605.1 glycosyltransferase [Nitrosopumilaceae archaeon]NIU88024.1 glycosyltransferase [Nitrosopumilaceae archaeon]NIV66291.1 glycosyltransferase [Nitrosopumilaceae archaeon]NIX62207.1 glycosyltransferase [Nitrosopumilaceae archaeon]
MEIVFDFLHYLFTAFLIGVSATWIILIRSMLLSFKKTPLIDQFEGNVKENPLVSVILPARNEENFIRQCIESLLNQDYSNYEIIAIDDSSDDNTGKIIVEYAENDSRIIPVKARPKPVGWMGKNWACMEGYQKAKGDLLLFTDSDTIHSPKVLRLATEHMLSLNVDALTAIPKMICLDFWTKVTLPVISVFLHTRFSALRVNDPKKKTGYFFGSFFIIKKEIYDSVGKHEGVKHEIVEDGALGKKVKEAGFNLKMVRADYMISAIWARNKETLWNALKRLMIPLYLQNGKIAIGIFVAVLFLMFVPFPALVYSSVLFKSSNSIFALFWISLISVGLIHLGSAVDASGLELKLRFIVFAILGVIIVVGSFLSGILQAKKDSAITWRGRKYSMKDHIQDSISI